MVRALILAMLALAVSAVPAFAQGQGAFKFEDYTERTAFEDTINQRFPIGSSYLAFKQQVIRAGAKASRDMYDTSKLHTHTFIKAERPTTGKNFLNTWTIAVSVNGDSITSISPTLAIRGAGNNEF